MKWLCLDIEGGHGGSSWSLFHAVTAPSLAMEVEVWTRLGGRIHARYEAAGVPTQTTPDMPRLTVVARPSRNLWTRLAFQRAWVRSAKFRTALETKARTVDGIHFNHESLFYLASWLSHRRTGATLTGHVRTRPPKNRFACAQARRYAAATQGLAFITENEATHTAALIGEPARGEVIYNPVPIPTAVPPRHEGIPDDGRFSVASIANFALVRGTDLLIPIAQELLRSGRRDIRIVVAGDMVLPGEAQRRLNTNASTLVQVARERGLGDTLLFLGHVSMPETVLVACDCILKPTPEANPWGRDILEAMALGLPAVSIGRYHRFVEEGITGHLIERGDPAALAAALIALADAPEKRAALGRAASARIAELCDPSQQAAALAGFWYRARNGCLTQCAG